MHNVARFSILVFIFTIPWENMLVIPGIGTISRLAGMLAFAMGLIAFLLQPQLRNMKLFHVLFLTFVMYSAVSYGWSLDHALSMERINSYLQLVLFVWLIWQFVETEQHVLFCGQSYVLGAQVGAVATVTAWLSGVQVVYLRYSAEGFDPNELSIILAAAIPLAWYLSLRQTSVWFVWLNRLSIPLLLFAILLTGSRTGLVVASVGTLFVLSTLARGSTSAKATVAILALLGVVALPQLIPESTWARLGTLENEITNGTMNHRTTIWSAGFDIWLNHLAFGVGTGAFRTATLLTHGFKAVSHNTFLSILVELGATGFLIFAGILFVTWQQLRTLPNLERKLYLTICFILILGLFTLTWETKKPVWLFCSLLLCHALARAEETDSVVGQTAEPVNTDLSTNLLQQKAARPLLASIEYDKEIGTPPRC